MLGINIHDEPWFDRNINRIRKIAENVRESITDVCSYATQSGGHALANRLTAASDAKSDEDNNNTANRHTARYVHIHM